MGMTGQQQQPGTMGMGHMGNNMAGMQGQRQMPQGGMSQPQGMYGQPQNTAQMQQMQYNQVRVSTDLNLLWRYGGKSNSCIPDKAFRMFSQGQEILFTHAFPTLLVFDAF